MRLADLLAIEKRKADKAKPKPTPIARYWGGYNGNGPMPADVRTVWDKYVKKSANGKEYVTQFQDWWYKNNFASTRPEVKDFDSFFNIIKPYFTVQRKQDL